MLRESTNHSGEEIDLRAVMGEGAGAGEIDDADILLRFAEAVTLRRGPEIETLRSTIIEEHGQGALIDAAAIVAAFHGFVRVADATGIKTEDERLAMAAPLQAELGIDRFRAAEAD